MPDLRTNDFTTPFRSAAHRTQPTGWSPSVRQACRNIVIGSLNSTSPFFRVSSDKQCQPSAKHARACLAKPLAALFKPPNLLPSIRYCGQATDESACILCPSALTKHPGHYYRCFCDHQRQYSFLPDSIVAQRSDSVDVIVLQLLKLG